eukprot:403346550
MQGGNRDDQRRQQQSQYGSSGMNFGGIPAHMDDNQKIVISGQRTGRQQQQSQQDLVLHRDHAGMFAEKMASVIGPSYVGAFFLGSFVGLTQIPPPQARRTYRLLINNYLNNIGKTSSRYGNNVGAAVFLYLIVGKSMNFVMQEELEGVSEEARSALFGAMTGAIYKSTRGIRPIVFASLLGAVCGSAYTYAWTKGNLRPSFM